MDEASFLIGSDGSPSEPSSPTPPKKKRGGHRPGGGLPKGYVFTSTLRKDEARELVRQMITDRLQPIIEAHVSNAKGLNYLVARDKQGKFHRLIGKNALEKAYKLGHTVEVWQKDPSVEAMKVLLDRALDQAPKPPEEHRVTVTSDFAMLDRAKERARAALTTLAGVTNSEE